VGLVVTAKPGQRVERGQPLATVHARDAAGLRLGLTALTESIVIGDEAPEATPLILQRLDRASD
jgi:thymidine phosphorylase